MDLPKRNQGLFKLGALNSIGNRSSKQIHGESECQCGRRYSTDDLFPFILFLFVNLLSSFASFFFLRLQDLRVGQPGAGRRRLGRLHQRGGLGAVAQLLQVPERDPARQQRNDADRRLRRLLRNAQCHPHKRNPRPL